MIFNNESGVLLHPTSLPGKYGVGEIGVSALKWLDILADCGQKIWQILPLGPTGYLESPYQCLSSFACNTQIICLESLKEENLLREDELSSLPSFPDSYANFGQSIPERKKLLHLAATRFNTNSTDYQNFIKQNAYWLNDYSLYSSIKEKNNLKSWVEWDKGLRDRNSEAISQFTKENAELIEQKKILQFLFEAQWQKVRNKAKELGIRIIGDLPIVVAHDSADVWSSRDLFKLDHKGQPTVVAGVPPDFFSTTGQRWGNPLYNWDKHRKENYAWWLQRLERTLTLCDIIRIDHFRGFAALYEIPSTCPTAEVGEWVPAPGKEIFTAAKERFGDIPIIAEDLGLITDDVVELRDNFNLPGMRILQFAFGSDDQNDSFHPRNYIQNCVAYTGTHDNDTSLGYFNKEQTEEGTRSKDDIEKELLKLSEFLGKQSDNLEWDLIKVLLESKAGAAIFPLQDILGLGSEARMNTPGSNEGNWIWRFKWQDLEESRLTKLKDLTESARRNHHQ